VDYSLQGMPYQSTSFGRELKTGFHCGAKAIGSFLIIFIKAQAKLAAAGSS